MATTRAFDTLGYAKFLASKGVEAKVAEALAEANNEFLLNDLATKEFVHNEIKQSTLELKIWLGKTFVVATGVLLTGIPVIVTILQRIIPAM